LPLGAVGFGTPLLAELVERGVDSRRQNAGRRAARTSGCTGDSLKAALGQGIELLKLDDRLDAVVTGLRQEAAPRALALPSSGSVQKRGEAAGLVARSTPGSLFSA